MSEYQICAVGYLLQNDQFFTENLTVFAHSNKNFDDMQQDIFGRWVMNVAPHVLKYKVMQL